MLSKKLQTYIVCFFLIITSFLYLTNVSHVYGDEKEVFLKFSQAGDSLEAAYLSLLKAERAGGEVSGLVELLNRALDLYSKADWALEYEEYETAIIFLDEVNEISGEVLEYSITLMIASEHLLAYIFRNQLFLSFGVASFFLLLGFIGWGKFKVYYIRMIMRLAPEVVADES